MEKSNVCQCKEKEGDIFFHKRIYRHFGKIAPEEPKTLEEMQPLFEQIYHGCKAGLYQEAYDVYWQKVRRLVNNFGDWETELSLIQNFFEDEDFQKELLVTRVGSRSYLINRAGLSMMMLGRLKEAEGLYRKYINLDIPRENWWYASMDYRNLALLQILTGSLKEAKESSEMAIQLSREAKDIRYECYSTACLAYTLFLLGDMAQAGIEFEKANELERRYDPSKRYLYSIWGIWYANFLLAEGKIPEALEVTNENLMICKEQNWINSINLCHRSLAAIYRHKKDFQSAEENITLALKGARKTGRQDIEASALIELARIRIEQCQYQSAESTIDQALKICQRCGYKLYEIDAELVLARAHLGLKHNVHAVDLAQSAYEKAEKIGYYLPGLPQD